MSDYIREIIINIETNSGKKDILKSSMFDNTKGVTLNSNPYFTADKLYPANELRILDYQQIVEFFFNETKFRSRLSGKPVDKDKYGDQNIRIMLGLLFPTTFPVEHNVYTSYDKYICEQNEEINISGKTRFSYLKLDSINTVLQVIWRNDILNNPTYREIIDNAIEYEKWLVDAYIRFKGKQIKFITEMQKNAKIKFTGDEITKLKESIADYAIDNSAKIFKTSIESLIEYINTFNKQTIHLNELNKDYIYIINKVIETYNNFKSQTQTIKSQAIVDIQPKITYLEKLLENINVYTNANDMIFSKDIEGIIIVYDEENSIETKKNEEKLASLKDEYAKHVEYVTFLTEKIVKFKLESGNRNLENEFSNYLKNKKNRFKSFIVDFKDQKEKGKILAKCEQLFDTSYIIKLDKIGSINKTYEIFLYIELMKGKMDYTNMSNINCKYQNDVLIQEFSDLTEKVNKWEIPKNHTYFDIDNFKPVNDAKPSANGTKPSASGGRFTRKYRKSFKSSSNKGRSRGYKILKKNKTRRIP
jgi:hypothetical protein